MISRNQLGNSIYKGHGVPQGRKSSSNHFSYVSDLGDAVNEIDTNDFLDPFNLAQLAG